MNKALLYRPASKWMAVVAFALTATIYLSAVALGSYRRELPVNFTDPEFPVVDGGEDLPDPIGGDTEEYRACARVIASQLDRLIPEWLGS